MAFLAPVAGFLVEAAFAVGMPISIGTALVGSAAILGFGAKAVYDYVIDGMMDDLNVDTMSNRTVTTKDPITPRRMVYGTTRTGGQIVYQANSGSDNKYLHNFVVFSVGQISRIHEIYFNNELAMRLDTSNNVRYYGRYSTNSDGSPSAFGRDVFITMKAGTDTQGAITGLANPPPDWTSEHKLSGLAYAYVQLTFNETTHANGFPNITAVVRGKKHYNPKYDNTVDGGSGDQRINDKDTWEYSNNPAVCLLNYMLDDNIGLGESIDSFHMPTLLDSIDTCDTTFDDTEVITTNEIFTVGDRYKIVTTGTGVDWASMGVSGTPQVGQIFTALDDGASVFGNELYVGSARRVYNTYACDGIIDSKNSHKSNIQNILSSMNGQIVYSNGKFRILAYDTKDPESLILTEKDILGNFDVITKQSRRNMYNRVRGKYMSSENNYTMTEYPVQKFVDSTTNEATFEIDDGEILYHEQTLPMTTRHANAQRLARLTLLRSRMQNTIKFTGTARCLSYTVGDRIYVSNETLGYSADDPKIYQVSNLSARIDTKNGLVVDIEAKEDAPSIYDWEMSDAEDFTTGSVVDLYDGLLPAPTFINALPFQGMYVGWLHPEYRESVEFELTVTAADPNFIDTSTYRTKTNTILVPVPNDIRKYKKYIYSVRAVDTATGATSDSISITKVAVAHEDHTLVIQGTDEFPTNAYIEEYMTSTGVTFFPLQEITYLQVDENGFIVNSVPYKYVDAELKVIQSHNAENKAYTSLVDYDILEGLGNFDTQYKRDQIGLAEQSDYVDFVEVDVNGVTEHRVRFRNAGKGRRLHIDTQGHTVRPNVDYKLTYNEYGTEGLEYTLVVFKRQADGTYENGHVDTRDTNESGNPQVINLEAVDVTTQYTVSIRGNNDEDLTQQFSGFRLTQGSSSLQDTAAVYQTEAPNLVNHNLTFEILDVNIPYDSVVTGSNSAFGGTIHSHTYYNSDGENLGSLTILLNVDPRAGEGCRASAILRKNYDEDIAETQVPDFYSADVRFDLTYDEKVYIDDEEETVQGFSSATVNLVCEIIEG
jgi:hypothetical protein